jgi:hypothetical protein
MSGSHVHEKASASGRVGSRKLKVVLLSSRKEYLDKWQDQYYNWSPCQIWLVDRQLCESWLMKSVGRDRNFCGEWTTSISGAFVEAQG